MTRAPQTTDSPDSEKLDPALIKVAIVVVLGSIMTILDTTIVSVALDTLGRSFKTSVSTIQWVSTGYLLSLAIVIPATSWFVHAFGAKRAWMVSITLFVAGSAMCGVSWSATSLIAFRFVQGVGAGMVLPIGQAILAGEAGPRRMGRVMGIVGAPSLLGPILGPVVGGLILSHFSWRWIFFVNVPIGIVALVLALRYMHPGVREERLRFDLVGLLLVSPGLAAIIYGLAEAGTGAGFGDPTAIGCLLGGAVLVAAFAIRSLHTSTPLLDLRLFGEKNFRAASLCSALTSGSVFATMFLLPLYYQVVRHQSPLHAALFLIPQTVGGMCIMPLAGAISDRAGSRRVTMVGVVVMAIGTYAFTRVGTNTNEAILFAAQFVRGIGIGLGIAPLQAAALRMVDKRHLPGASTLFNILQRVGSAIAVALVAVVLQGRLRSTVHAVSLAQVSVHTSPRTLEFVASAFASSYWWNFGFVALAFVSTLFLSGRENPETTFTGASPVASSLTPEARR